MISTALSLIVEPPPVHPRQVAQDPGNVKWRDLAAYRMTSGRSALERWVNQFCS